MDHYEQNYSKRPDVKVFISHFLELQVLWGGIPNCTDSSSIQSFYKGCEPKISNFWNQVVVQKDIFRFYVSMINSIEMQITDSF